MSRVAPASTLSVVLALLTGCGDSLLGGEGLGELGTYAPPERPAWELRWYRGDGLGFSASCQLEPVDADQMLVDALPFGFVDAPEPEVGTPPTFVEGGSWRYAIALVLLIERPLNSGMQRLSSASSPLAGVWGAATYQVLLWAEGDLDALSAALDVGDASYLVQGPQFVDILLPETDFLGHFDGALWAPEPVGYELLLPVEAEVNWWVPWPGLLSGEARGGTTFEPCGG